MKRSRVVQGSIICTGTEFLVAYEDEDSQPVDLNGPMIKNALAMRGVDVIHQVIKPDDIPLQMAEVAHSLAIGATLIACNAGTGTSEDDGIKRVISGATGRRLVEYPQLRRLIAPRQRLLGDANNEVGFAEAVTNLAALPEGAEWLPPPGTAAPFFLIHEGKLYVSTPGPPAEARPAIGALLEHDQVQAWLAAAIPLRLITARFFGDLELPINEALREAEARGIFANGLRRPITCVPHAGAESDVQLQVEPGQEGQAAAIIRFLQERCGAVPFSSGPTLDQLLGRALAGRSTTVCGAGPAATEAYLRLWGRAPVSARLFLPDPVRALLAPQSGPARARKARPHPQGEQLAIRTAERGLVAGRSDFAIAIVGKSPAWLCLAGVDGQRITASLTCPLERLDGVDDAVLEVARNGYYAHELLRVLLEAAQQ